VCEQHARVESVLHNHVDKSRAVRAFPTWSRPMPSACTASSPRPTAPVRVVTLRREIAERLAAHCAATGDKPSDVVEDAVVLSLDAYDAEEGGS